jgi:serine/threonine protein phosphatase PrpC
MVSFMNNTKVFAVTTKGANHIKAGKECQDYSLAIQSTDKEVETHIGKDNQPKSEKQQRFKNKKPVCCMAIVADGHGGDEFIRSAKGSRFAVESARDCIADFLRSKKGKSIEKEREEIQQLVRSIVKTWNEKVGNDVNIRPFGNSELANLPKNIQAEYKNTESCRRAYGTTLITVVVLQNFWFGIHIGDGRCTMLNHAGDFSQPIPWDDRCFLNVTTSICDDDIVDQTIERKRYFVGKELPVGIFLCSDGIDDSYPVNDNEKYLAKFYRSLALSFLNDNDPVKGIQSILPKLSEKGSGDDMSIAGILNIESLKKIEPKLKEQIASEQAKAEEVEAAAQKEEKIEKALGEIDKKSQSIKYGQSSTLQINTNVDMEV